MSMNVIMFVAISSLLILSGILSYSIYISFCCVICIGKYGTIFFNFGVKLYLHLSRMSNDIYNVYVSKAFVVLLFQVYWESPKG